MEIAPVDYMPVPKIPSEIAKKAQKSSLYLDEEEFKKVKKESGCVAMTEFRLYGYRSFFNFSPFNLNNNSISRVALSYDDNHNKDRGFKTILGLIVDTLA